MAKVTEAHSGKLGKEKSIPLSEIGKSAGIEPVSENDFNRNMELEAFMEEYLEIYVAEDNSPESLPVVTPSVNGINQPIVRGVKTRVKRKYVEAMARGTYSRYEQQTLDSRRPENIQMVEKKALTYPFTVYHDPNPNGREWLQSVLAGG